MRKNQEGFMNQTILTVLGKDRPGIIATVTGCLFKAGCNLEDISMTILEGEFAMICIIEPNKNKLTYMKNLFEGLAKRNALTFFWKDLKSKKKLTRGEKHKRGSETYVISVFGKDRLGIVYQVSQILARNHLNITDLNCKILGKDQKSLYMMVLEVDIPKSFSLKKLHLALAKLSKSLGVDYRMNPLEIIEI